MKRMWSFLSSLPSQKAGTAGIDMRLLADVCEPGADPFAVWLRATLLRAAVMSGRLDERRDGDKLQDKVFEAAAGFAIPEPQKPDLEAFFAAME